MGSQTLGSPTEKAPSEVSACPPDRSLILTVNGGSSSLKFALFDRAEPPARWYSGRIERIGLPDPRLIVNGADGSRHETAVDAPDLQAVAGLLIQWLEHKVGHGALAAVGHRVVHGGGRYYRPEPVTDELFADLRRIGPYAPITCPARSS